MNPDLSDNVSLINSLKNGDSRAYSYLMDNSHQNLCVYAYGLTKDYDQAEDIVQNVFMRLWRRRRDLKTEYSIQNFLYRSVYNEFIDHYRKHRKILPLEKKHIETLNDFVEQKDTFAMNELLTLVRSEIQNLPPKCRETFLLSKEEGLSNKEIAKYLNISIKTVEAHITKAYTILRKKISDSPYNLLLILLALILY